MWIAVEIISQGMLLSSGLEEFLGGVSEGLPSAPDFSITCQPMVGKAVDSKPQHYFELR